MRLTLDEEVGNNIEHGVESLRPVVVSNQVVKAEEISELGLGHSDLGPLVFSHENVVSAVETTLFEEFADEETGKILGRELS